MILFDQSPAFPLLFCYWNVLTAQRNLKTRAYPAGLESDSDIKSTSVWISLRPPEAAKASESAQVILQSQNEKIKWNWTYSAEVCRNTHQHKLTWRALSLTSCQWVAWAVTAPHYYECGYICVPRRLGGSDKKMHILLGRICHCPVCHCTRLALPQSRGNQNKSCCINIKAGTACTDMIVWTPDSRTRLDNRD